MTTQAPSGLSENGTPYIAPPDPPEPGQNLLANLDEDVSDFVRKLHARLEPIQHEIATHQGAIAQLKLKERWITGLLRTVAPDLGPTKQGRRQDRKGSGSAKRPPTPDKVLRVLDALEVIHRQQTPGTPGTKFTINEVHEAIESPWTYDTTRKAFNFLREAQIIGKAGKGAGKGAADNWRITHWDNAAKLRTALQGEIAAQEGR